MSLNREPGDEPKKRRINLNLDQFDPDVLPLVEGLVTQINETLYIWETFPIVLPEVVSARLNQHDLFLQPQFSEDMRRVGTTSNGQRKYFTKEQLESVRQTGEFQAESEQFPGQFHRWILSRFLIKGQLKVQESFLCDLSKAAYLMATVARRCLYSSSFSLAQGINFIFRSLMINLDMLIGLPNLETVDLEAKLQIERSQYLVAELKSSCPETLKALNDWLQSSKKNGTLSSRKKSDLTPPVAVPYKFTSPNGVEINLSLCNKEIISDAKPYLHQILANAMQGWIPERRKELLSEFTEAGIKDDDLIEDEIGSRITTEYLDKVCNDVLMDTRLKSIGKDVPRLLVHQVKTYCVIRAALDLEKRDLELHISNLELELMANHPVFSKLNSWMHDKLSEARIKYMSEHMWDAHTNAIKGCDDLGLNQSAYFLRRDLAFRQEREPRLKGELEKVQQPAKTFIFSTNIWLPKNWIIKEKFESTEDFREIPTLIASNADYSVDHTTKRSKTAEYTVTKTTERTNTTKYPFWRWTNFILSTVTNFWNSLFLFGVCIPWCSTLSLRALFWRHPFYPNYEVNTGNGKLRKSLSSRTHTLSSRVGAIWNHIQEDFEAFENAPDTGLLSKSVSRFIKYIVNYVLKGVGGTSLLVVTMTVGCLSASLASITIAVLSPVLVPAFTLFYYLLGFLFYDFGGNLWMDAVFWNFFVNFLILGVGQTVVCVSVSFVFCPIGWTSVTLWGLGRKVLRNTWDTCVFQLIRNRVRIPLKDDFLTTRISGPGMASQHYYQIKPPQALATLEARMDRDKLKQFGIQTRKQIMEPEDKCRAFVEKFFKPMGFNLGTEGPLFEIHKSCQSYISHLDTKVEERLGKCSPELSISMKSLIRLTESDLELVLMAGSSMVEAYYSTEIFPMMTPAEITSFWDEKGLVPSDWLALCASLLCEEFSAMFTTPLQQEDSSFLLKTEHWNMDRFVNMAYDTKWRDDLQVSKIIRTLKPTATKRLSTKTLSTKIEDAPPRRRSFLSQPKIPVDAFNPMSFWDLSDIHRLHDTRSFLMFKRWMIFNFTNEGPTPDSKLVNPLPQCHPLEICLLIHNRDACSSSAIDQAYSDIIRNLCEPRTLPDCESAESPQHIFSDQDDDEDESADDDEAPQPSAEPLLSPRKSPPLNLQKSSNSKKSSPLNSGKESRQNSEMSSRKSSLTSQNPHSGLVLPSRNQDSYSTIV